LRVANVEAVTVQSRDSGLVTIGPTMIRSVWDRTWEYRTNGSCHSTTESNVQKWEKPAASAATARSIRADAGGSLCRTRPMSRP
jgi:hypothetical protein